MPYCSDWKTEFAEDVKTSQDWHQCLSVEPCLQDGLPWGQGCIHDCIGEGTHTYEETCQSLSPQLHAIGRYATPEFTEVDRSGYQVVCGSYDKNCGAKCPDGKKCWNGTAYRDLSLCCDEDKLPPPLICYGHSIDAGANPYVIVEYVNENWGAGCELPMPKKSKGPTCWPKGTQIFSVDYQKNCCSKNARYQFPKGILCD